MTLKRPMLACKDASSLSYPLLASPKIDGVRAVVVDGRLLSRSLKPIRNVYTQSLFGHPELNGLDGELVVGEPTDPNLMQQTTSGVMSIDGTPDVYFYVFDKWEHSGPFESRLAYASAQAAGAPRVRMVPHSWVHDDLELQAYENTALSMGFEGVMLRDPQGAYKQGRSTAREGGLTKLKRFTDAEAVVVRVEERMHNDNAATLNELGLTKRSTHAAGKRPAGDLGALVCRTPAGVEVSIGTGFSAEQRRGLWDRKESLPGLVAKYKFFNHGVVEAPRHPVFVGFRHEEDT